MKNWENYLLNRTRPDSSSMDVPMRQLSLHNKCRYVRLWGCSAEPYMMNEVSNCRLYERVARHTGSTAERNSRVPTAQLASNGVKLK